MKYGKSKVPTYVKVIVLIVLIILLIITGVSIKKEKKLNFIEKGIKDTVVFIGETMYAPIKFVRDKVEIYKDKENIYKKYKELESEKENIEQKNATISELEKENNELKEVLSINESLNEYERINATVVSRDVGYWYDKFVINKGSKDGIRDKMAVVINNGLIGYISEVSNHSANVQLLTRKTLKTKISIKIDLGNNKYANGILEGYDEKKGVYNIEGISYSGEIPENAVVTTTGLSDNFPSGILIGYVTSTTTDNFDLGKIVEVKPSISFDNINYVTVLDRKGD
jgi:rod shape-determining protein MreC